MNSRRILWQRAAGKGFVADQYSRLCSVHFARSAYSLKTNLLDLKGSKRVLSSDAVPTLFLPDISEPSRRDIRIETRKRRALVSDALAEYNFQNKKPFQIQTQSDMATQTTYVTELCNQIFYIIMTVPYF